MSDNPLTRAVSRTDRRPLTSAPKSPPKGRIVKQSTTKIEYRNPLSALDEKYLGSCNHPFTKSQYEKLIRSPKIPPSFLSIRASQPKGGNVCLYASSVFGGTALAGLIGKLKNTCTAVAGNSAKASCEELIKDLERRLPEKPATPKLPSLHDPRALNPLSREFWKDRWRGGWGGADFAIGMGFIAGVAWAVKTLLVWAVKKIVEKFGGGGGTTGGTPTGGGKEIGQTKPEDAETKPAEKVASAERRARSEVSSTARDLIASGAAYLNQAHVRASIQKFRLEHVNEKFALLRGRDGKLWTLPKMQLPASARVRSIVLVNVAALRPAPVGFRVPIRVTP